MLAALVHRLEDFELAEEALQEAAAAALQRWPSAGVPAAPAEWLVTVARNRALDRLRRQRTAHAKYQQLSDAGEKSETMDAPYRQPGQSRGRAPEPDLHLRSPGARRGGAGGADPSCGGRAHCGGDRSRVPGVRGDDGAAPGARQAQDPRRRDRLPGPARPPAARAARRRARGALPRLPRGLYRNRRRRSASPSALRGGDPTGQAGGRADARRARGPGARRAHAAARLAPRRAHRPRKAIWS